VKEKYIFYTVFMGRPPKGETERVFLKMDAAVFRRLEKYRERFKISRTRAIEYLLAHALGQSPDPFKIGDDEAEK
jgi:hypothetical protein